MHRGRRAIAQEDPPKLNATGREGRTAFPPYGDPDMAWSPPYSKLPPGLRGRPRVGVRRARRLAGFALLAIGLLLIAEATVTVLWQEPFTSLLARGEQKKLAAELDRVTPVDAPANRLPAVADRLERRTSEGAPLGRIVIPRIGAKFVFVKGTTTTDLEKGPGQYTDTALPGARGTVGIAGHRTTYLAPFRRIDALEPGDRIELRMPYGNFSYTVAGTKIVSPGDVSVLRHRSGDWLVLTACHPLYSAARRIVVSARLRR
jgi:sortase A